MIWCEDHGDLAFYREAESETDIHLGAGDLVEFDLTTERQFRYANNPTLVADHFSTGLAEALTDAKPRQPVVQTGNGSAQIIPFETVRAGGRGPSSAMRQSV